MRLETERLIIRSFAATDIAEFAPIVADPEVMRHIGTGAPMTEAEAQAYVEKCIHNEHTIGYARYALRLKDDGRLIGFCGYGPMPDYIDFGYRLAPWCWGQGLAVEAATATIDYGFRDLKLTEIVATAFLENTRSLRVIEKLGFTYTSNIIIEGRKAKLHVLRNPSSAQPGR